MQKLAVTKINTNGIAYSISRSVGWTDALTKSMHNNLNKHETLHLPELLRNMLSSYRSASIQRVTCLKPPACQKPPPFTRPCNIIVHSKMWVAQIHNSMQKKTQKTKKENNKNASNTKHIKHIKTSNNKNI